MIGTSLERHFDRTVGAAVIDDKPFDLSKPAIWRGSAASVARQYLLLVVAWDLDNELAHVGNDG